MKHIKLLAVFTSILSLLACSKEEPFIQYSFEDTQYLHQKRLRELLPHDIAEYILKYEMCVHWRGEYGYDQARSKQIENEIEINCTDLDKDQNDINKKYRTNLEITEAYNSIFNDIINGIYSFEKNDPDRKSTVLDIYYEAKAQWTIKTVSEQIPQSKIDFEKYLQEKSNTTISILKNTIFKLEVQKRYSEEILLNIDRLHPMTKTNIIKTDALLDQILATYLKQI